MVTVAVIGAGVAGLTCACELADRGVAVQVFERGDDLGDHACSWYAGGMLAPWCEQESAEDIVVRLGLDSAEWWSRHSSSVRRNGSLVLAPGRDRRELSRFSRLTDHHDQIGATAIADLEPDLAGRFNTGLSFPGESHLEPRRALADLVSYLRDRGIEIAFGREVDPSAHRADWVIDCRGYSARDALPALRGVKGEMLVLRSHEITLSRPIRFLHPRIPLYIVPWAEQRFMVGATMIENDQRSRISARSVLELLSAAYAVHPLFSEAEVVEMGVDVRPAFIDNVPRVSVTDRTVRINGLFRHGFLLGPAMARQAADVVFGQRVGQSVAR